MTAILKPWIAAFRLRTLPLALSSIGMGSFLAAYSEDFHWPVFLFCALTTVFLQVLSNLANDYGDYKHGADNEHRRGPDRLVQSGQISPDAMRTAIIITGILAFCSGIYLLYLSLGFNKTTFMLFLSLGILAILAAITYTAGSRPYGYAGLGDISVLIFFGIVGVIGTYYLHTMDFYWQLILPALSCGFFSVAVLNINNIRDIDSDKRAGKHSIPVRLGRSKAVVYHYLLLASGISCALVFVMINMNSWFQYLFLAITPLMVRNALAIKSIENPQKLDPFLKQMALATLLFVIFFGMGLLMG